MDRETREERNGPRRKRYRYVEVGVPLTERPCGCEGGAHFLATGIRFFECSSMPGVRNDQDAEECLMCGATWAMADRLGWWQP